MVRLGDNFPDGDKSAYVERHLTPGAILYLFCRFTKTPKEKYVVVVAMEPRLLLFAINSEISHFVRSRHMVAYQLKLQSDEYDCLDHDSYLDCAQAISDMTRDDIVNQLVADVSRIKGHLTDTTVREIISTVDGAKTITPRDQKAIISALSPEQTTS